MKTYKTTKHFECVYNDQDEGSNIKDILVLHTAKKLIFGRFVYAPYRYGYCFFINPETPEVTEEMDREIKDIQTELNQNCRKCG